MDPGGPAGSLLADLTAAGVDVVRVSAREHAQACGQLYDAVVPRAGNVPSVRHTGQACLTSALAGAEKRDLADLWAWARKAAGVDIAPLVAVTLAVWGFTVHGPGVDYDVLASVL